MKFVSEDACNERNFNAHCGGTFSIVTTLTKSGQYVA